MALLETDRVWKKFGGVTAVQDIALSIEKGEILGMIGPNGSGKTSFINLLSGIYRPDKGRILFAGDDITELPAHLITKKGIARTFQNLRVFPNISVLDNLLIGRHCRVNNSLANIYLNPLVSRKREKEAEERVIELLEWVHLGDRRKELAKNLPYGEQRLLEICRALASEPLLLLLDEPCAGMNPIEMDTLAAFLKDLRGRGTTLFIIEHNMRFIMSIAERIVVLDAGAKFREGTPGQIQKDKEVQRIYLGEEEEA
ncbi:MAG: ABC transporter ATP-binding protein [Desulfobacterota bacterium]|nr:ABC transporter ATP-binding protein [Thermodesulfobacteriota bacterium]